MLIQSLVLANFIILSFSQIINLPGSRFKHVSAKGNFLWAITEHNQAVEYVNSTWIYYNRGVGTAIAATSTGGAYLINQFYSIDLDNVYKFDRISNTFYFFGGWAFIINGDAGMHVGRDGRLYKQINGGWDNSFSFDINNLQGSIGVDGDMWRIDQNYNLYHYTNETNGRKWNRVDFGDASIGSPVYVDANDAKNVVITDSSGNAFLSRDGGQTWSSILSTNCIQATVGSIYVYCLTSTGQIQQISLDSIDTSLSVFDNSNNTDNINNLNNGETDNLNTADNLNNGGTDNLNTADNNLNNGDNTDNNLNNGDNTNNLNGNANILNGDNTNNLNGDNTNILNGDSANNLNGDNNGNGDISSTTVIV